jgi:hypothetical protein
MLLALIAAAHAYLLPWKMLFVLPAGSEKPCAVSALRYGAPGGKWERAVHPRPDDCQFRVSVHPGPLLPVWVEAGPEADQLEVTFTVQGGKEQTLSLPPEKIEPVEVRAADLSARASKVRSAVRVEVKNASQRPVLLGDAVALRGKPKDDCVGPGPAAVVQPGESLVDQRPGTLSPSMKIWVSAFTGEKQCRWIEVRRAP